MLGVAASAMAHHPHDFVKAFALNPEFPVDGTMLVWGNPTEPVFGISRDHGRSWSTTGAGTLGGTILGLEFASDWETSGTAYAASNRGGVYRTIDRARTWRPITQPRSVLNLAAAPASADPTIFFATRDTLFDRVGGASNETALIGFDHALVEIDDIGVSPAYDADSTVAIVTSDWNFHISRDGGDTWSVTALVSPAREVEFSPDYANDETLWLAGWGSGVLRSTDGGVSFSVFGTGLDELRVTDVVASPEYRTTRELWASTAEEGLYQSFDSGETWTRNGLVIPTPQQTDVHYRIVQIAGRYGTHPFVALGAYAGVYISTDGGQRWYQSNYNPTRYVRDLRVSPTYSIDQTVIANCYGMGELVSEDAGENWDHRFTDFGSILAFSMGVSPNFADDQTIIVGSEHGIRRSTDRGVTWEIIDIPKAWPDLRMNHIIEVDFATDYATSGIVYAAGRQVHWDLSTTAAVYRSTDHGVTWEALQTEIENPQAMAISPDFSADSVVYLGASTPDGFFRSDDGGRTFVPLARQAVKQIVVPPDYTATKEVFVVSDLRGVSRSTDQGISWEEFNDGLGGAHALVLRLAPDYLTSRKMLLSTFGNGLFELDGTTDAPSWRRITAVDSPVSYTKDFSLSDAYADDRTIFAGNLEGVWRSRDGGAHWDRMTVNEFYDDDRSDPWLHQGEEWFRVSLAGSYNYGVTLAAKAGHKLALPFYGSGFKLFGVRGPDAGHARVVLDGEVVAEFDGYSEELETQYLMAEASDLDPGLHVVTIQVLGTKNPLAGGRIVGVDGVEVTYGTAVGDQQAMPPLADLNRYPWGWGPGTARATGCDATGVPDLRDRIDERFHLGGASH